MNEAGPQDGRASRPRRRLLLKRPVRAREVLALVLALLLLAFLVRASGWMPVSPEPLPVTSFAPRVDADPRHAQTLAHGTFEADGGAFAWEVFGFPEIGGGIHSYQYRVHRIGGADTFIWPEAALLHHERRGNLGESPPGEDATVEQGVLVVRQGFQPRGPEVYELTAVLRLEVVRDVAWGARALDPVEVSLPVRIVSR